MKQNTRFKVIAIVFTVMLLVFAGAMEMSATPQKNKLISRALPDLIVRDIRLVNGCQIQVTITNIGKAGVPDSFYNLPKAVGVQMYKDGAAWGGLILSGFDPEGKLKHPGASVSHIWFPNAENLKLTPGVHTIKVVVDHAKVMAEARENNNELTRRVKCGSTGGIGTPGGFATPGKFDIRNIRFSPGSPAKLNFNDQVKVGFKYWSPVDDVLIFARPMTNGNLTPNYAASGSPQYSKANGKPGDGNFTITSGAVTVDAVRFRIVNKTNKEKVYFEKIVPVKYTFPKLSVAIATPGVIAVAGKAPQRFFLDFTDAYMAIKTPQNSIQIIAEKNVLSYGSDWEVCKLKDYLYHVRQKVWQGFYWKINTSRKEVYKVTGGTFCQLGGSDEKLNFTVKTTGPFIYIHFPKSYLVYVPSSKTLQIVAELMVLSYGGDWGKCNKAANEYQLRLNSWQGFFWKINTFSKVATRIKGGSFCGAGGTPEPLPATSVRVIK